LYTSRTPAERLQITSGKFTANAAWLTLATIAFNLMRAAGAAASPRHAHARWATLRTHLIAVPARIATSARRLVLHLPRDWPWQPAWQDLWATAPTPDHYRRTGPEERPDVEEPDRPANPPRPPKVGYQTTAKIGLLAVRSGLRRL